MKTIAAYLAIAAVMAVLIAIFTGHTLWLLPISILLTGSLQKLFIWLFIDPDFEKRQRDRLIPKAVQDQNNPSI